VDTPTVGTHPLDRPTGKSSSLVAGVVERPDGAVSWRGHEADDGEQGRPDGPGRLPGLWVEARNGQTDFLANLKTSIGRQYYYIRWLHGILGWHNNSSMVHPTLKVGIAGPPDSKVPLKQVVLQGLGVVVLVGLT